MPDFTGAEHWYILAGIAFIWLIQAFLRPFIGQLSLRLFKPINEIEGLKSDLESVKTRVSLLEQSQDTTAEILNELKEDIRYIRSRIDDIK